MRSLRIVPLYQFLIKKSRIPEKRVIINSTLEKYVKLEYKNRKIKLIYKQKIV